MTIETLENDRRYFILSSMREITKRNDEETFLSIIVYMIKSVLYFETNGNIVADIALSMIIHLREERDISCHIYY